MRAQRGGNASWRTWCSALAFSIVLLATVPALGQQPAAGQPPTAATAGNSKGGEAGAAAASTAPTANKAKAPSHPVQSKVDADEGESEGWWPRIEDWLRNDAAGVGKTVGLAVLFFIIGWLVAKLLAWLFFRLLCRTDWDERVFKRLGLTTMLQREGAAPNQSERIMATIVFWLLMMIVVIATLQYAGLSQAAKPIQTFVDRIAAAMPLVGKAVLIMLAAYAAGLALGGITTKFFDQSRIDDRFLQLAGEKKAKEGEEQAAETSEEAATRPFSEAAGRVVFWLMMVVGVAGAVDALKIGPLANGMQNAIDQILKRLPQVGLAALLMVSGYVLGRIARATVDNLLDSAGFNKLVEKAKLSRVFGERKASDVAGIIAMVFIILQLAIAALNEVELTTLSGPLTRMMAQFWNALPSVALAAVIVAAGVIAARIVREIVEAGLDNLGFSEWMDRLGVSAITERSERLQKPHQLIGLIVFVAIILLAVVQALEKLELSRWASYVNGFLTFSVARVAIALVIVGVGLGIANYVRDIIMARRKDDADDAVRWMAMFARYGILVFAVCMGVSHLEIGDSFVIITFSLLFGSLCLALALSFGLGSRGVAGDIVRRQYDRAKRELSGRAERPTKSSES